MVYVEVREQPSPTSTLFATWPLLLLSLHIAAVWQPVLQVPGILMAPPRTSLWEHGNDWVYHCLVLYGFWVSEPRSLKSHLLRVHMLFLGVKRISFVSQLLYEDTVLVGQKKTRAPKIPTLYNFLRRLWWACRQWYLLLLFLLCFEIGSCYSPASHPQFLKCS